MFWDSLSYFLISCTVIFRYSYTFKSKNKGLGKSEQEGVVGDAFVI